MDSIAQEIFFFFFYTSKIPETISSLLLCFAIAEMEKKGDQVSSTIRTHPLPGSCWLLAAAAAAAAFAAQKTNAKTKIRTQTTTRQETGRARKETEGLKDHIFTALEWNSADKKWFCCRRSPLLLWSADLSFHHKFVFEVANLVAVEC